MRSRPDGLEIGLEGLALSIVGALPSAFVDQAGTDDQMIDHTVNTGDASGGNLNGLALGLTLDLTVERHGAILARRLNMADLGPGLIAQLGQQPGNDLVIGVWASILTVMERQQSFVGCA